LRRGIGLSAVRLFYRSNLVLEKESPDNVEHHAI